jgi:hypothetical protein
LPIHIFLNQLADVLGSSASPRARCALPDSQTHRLVLALFWYAEKDPHESTLHKHPRLPQQPIHVRKRQPHSRSHTQGRAEETRSREGDGARTRHSSNHEAVGSFLASAFSWSRCSCRASLNSNRRVSTSAGSVAATAFNHKLLSRSSEGGSTRH